MAENTEDSPFECAEWKDIETMYLCTTNNLDRKHFENTYMAILKFVVKRYPKITFRSVEEKMREINAIPHLFAEHPLKSKNNPNTPPAKMKGVNMEYILILNTRPKTRGAKLKEVEKGCWDVEENLRRLEKAAPASCIVDDGRGKSGSITLMEVLRRASELKSGEVKISDPSVFEDLKNLIKSDEEAKKLWLSVKVAIICGNDCLIPRDLFNKVTVLNKEENNKKNES